MGSATAAGSQARVGTDSRRRRATAASGVRRSAKSRGHTRAPSSPDPQLCGTLEKAFTATGSPPPIPPKHQHPRSHGLPPSAATSGWTARTTSPSSTARRRRRPRPSTDTSKGGGIALFNRAGSPSRRQGACTSPTPATTASASSTATACACSRVGRARLRRLGRRGGVRAPVRAGARLGRRALRGRLRQPPHPADHAGGLVTSVAGSGAAGHRDGLGSHACFYNPCGIAIDGAARHRRPRPARPRHSPPRPLLLRTGLNVMYVADYSNNCVRVVSRGGVVGTLSKDGETPLDSPYGIAVTRPDRRRAPPAALCLFLPSHSLAAITLEEMCRSSPDAAPRPPTARGARPPSTRPTVRAQFWRDAAQFSATPAQPWRNFLTRASLSRSLRPSPGLAVDADDVLYVATRATIASDA